MSKLSLQLKRLWPCIHIIGSTFDITSNKEAFKCFFYSLANLLPDENARLYMYQFIKEYPIDNYLQTNARAFYWTYLLHEFINVQLNKKKKLTFEEVKELYNSDDIDKTTWGNAYWTMIHIIAKYIVIDSRGNIPKEVKHIFINFINCLQKLLPCEKCREHMYQHLKKYPPEKYMDTRINIFYWTVLFHNIVNSTLNKPNLKFETAIKLY